MTASVGRRKATEINGSTRQAMYVKRDNDERSRNHCCRGNAIRNTYSECVFVAVVTQHAKRMRCIILSAVAFPALSYFYKLSR